MKKIIGILLITLIIGWYTLSNCAPELTTTISLQEHINDSLTLVNGDYALKQDPTNLVKIPQNSASNLQVKDGYYVQNTVLQPLLQLLKAAEDVGITHFTINSAYRSGVAQQKLFEAKGATYAQQRGHSEHQTGLSLDIGSTQGTMEATEEGQWLAEHAHEHGFILRYPLGKEGITGIAYEPWHFRYVGLPHSQVMFDKELTFEEYLMYVEEQGSYIKKINNTTYFVQYTTNEKMAEIPDVTSFSVSRDNRGGKIITNNLN